MEHNDNEKKDVKIPSLSPESVTPASVAVLCFQDQLVVKKFRVDPPH
jgi:hypothetical protein